MAGDWRAAPARHWSASPRPDDPFELPAATRLVHLHVTDKLFGSSPADAADACARLVQRLDVPVVIGLHDVPLGDADDIAKGRVEAYRRFAALGDVIVVASSAEARRLRGFAGTVDVAVLPLPIPVTARGPRAARTDGRLGVLGFVYPGKGHPTVLDAAGLIGADVVAVGGVQSRSRRSGRIAAPRRRPPTGSSWRSPGRFGAIGSLVMRRRSPCPSCPACAPPSSASLMSWIGAGRRPLVAANEHTVEVAERLGGHLQLFDGTAPSLAPLRPPGSLDPGATWSRSPRRTRRDAARRGPPTRIDTPRRRTTRARGMTARRRRPPLVGARQPLGARRRAAGRLPASTRGRGGHPVLRATRVAGADVRRAPGRRRRRRVGGRRRRRRLARRAAAATRRPGRPGPLRAPGRSRRAFGGSAPRSGSPPPMPTSSCSSIRTRCRRRRPSPAWRRGRRRSRTPSSSGCATTSTSMDGRRPLSAPG